MAHRKRSTSNFKFKSSTLMEMNIMKPEVDLLKEKVFIKRRKLVLFIDSSTENLLNFKKCVKKMEFTGTAVYHQDVQSALDFLATVELPRKASGTANLIFCQFKMPDITGLQIIEKLKKLNELRKIEEAPRVIICSAFSLTTFKSYVLQQGALGFLPLPCTFESFLECCVEHRLCADA